MNLTDYIRKVHTVMPNRFIISNVSFDEVLAVQTHLLKHGIHYHDELVSPGSLLSYTIRCDYIGAVFYPKVSESTMLKVRKVYPNHKEITTDEFLAILPCLKEVSEEPTQEVQDTREEPTNIQDGLR